MISTPLDLTSEQRLTTPLDLRLTTHSYAPRCDRHDVLAPYHRLPRGSALPVLSWCGIVLKKHWGFSPAAQQIDEKLDKVTEKTLLTEISVYIGYRPISINDTIGDSRYQNL